jgi:type I restriction enzyme S subunit
MSFDKLNYHKGDPLSLPKGWEIKKLGEVCTIKGRIGYRGYTKQDLVEKGEGAISLSPSNIFNNKFISDECTYISWFKYEESPEIMIFNGDILFVKTGSTYGKVALVEDLPEKATINPQFVVLKELKCLNKYLYYSMTTRQFKEQVEGIIGGAATPTLSQTNLAELKITLPPLPEQQRIVSILDECFAAIAKAKANAEQNLKNVKELFENSLQTIFTIKGKDWSEKLLGELATFRNGINYTKGSKGERIQIVGVKDFQNSFWVPTDNLDEVVIDGTLNETDRLHDGDILAVRSNGNPQLIGRTLLAVNIQGQVSHSGFTIRIRLNSKNVLPNYLCRYLKTQKTRKELIESGNGVGIKSLNQGSLSSLKIPFPTSVKEQEIIIEKLDLISEQTKKLEAIYRQKLLNLEELKKSVLQKAFAGEI